MAERHELVFSTLPYIVVYHVTEDAVEISRIFQGRARLAVSPALFPRKAREVT
jgi:plasmid stabilization system protein ParE